MDVACGVGRLSDTVVAYNPEGAGAVGIECSAVGGVIHLPDAEGEVAVVSLDGVETRQSEECICAVAVLREPVGVVEPASGIYYRLACKLVFSTMRKLTYVGVGILRKHDLY